MRRWEDEALDRVNKIYSIMEEHKDHITDENKKATSEMLNTFKNMISVSKELKGKDHERYYTQMVKPAVDRMRGELREGGQGRFWDNMKKSNLRNNQ